MAAGERGRSVEAAVDAQGRHAVDLVGICQLFRAVGLGADAEGLHGLRELGAVDAARVGKSNDFRLAAQSFVLLVDGVEHLAVHGWQLPHFFQRIEQLLVQLVRGHETHGDLAEAHVSGQLLDPDLQRGLEGVAVRTAVPEELHDFDLLVRAGQRHRGWR